MAVSRFHGSGADAVIFVDFKTRSVTLGRHGIPDSRVPERPGSSELLPTENPLLLQLRSLKTSDQSPSAEEQRRFEEKVSVVSSPSDLSSPSGRSRTNNRPLETAPLHRAIEKVLIPTADGESPAPLTIVPARSQCGTRFNDLTPTSGEPVCQSRCESERSLEESLRLFAAVDAHGDCVLAPAEQRRVVQILRTVMGLSTHAIIKLDPDPQSGSIIRSVGSTESYEYIAGEILTRSAKGHRASVPFTLPYPLAALSPSLALADPELDGDTAPHSELSYSELSYSELSYTLGGLVITPATMPGLPTALLRALTNYENQGLVALHSPSPGTFTVATATLHAGKHSRPYHLYSITTSPIHAAVIREVSAG